MKWCNENEIDVNDIFLIDQMASMQQHHSNESYAAICKQDGVIKNKLNQVLANKTVNKKAIYISRKHSFNSFKPAPSKKQKFRRTHQALDHQMYLKNKKKNVLSSKRKNSKSHLYPLI